MIYTNHHHLVADTLEELHKFARGIGLTREHYHHRSIGRQRCYYRIKTTEIRERVINKGAKIISTRRLVGIANKLPDTDIYSERINQFLFQYFHNYSYKLCNSFVFEWESDFFGMSKSCYFIEGEIKISRGDFFKDFEKPKHKLFSDLHSGKKIAVRQYNYGTRNPGDLIAKYFQPEINTTWGPFSRRGYHQYHGHLYKNSDNWKPETVNGKPGYWVNDWGWTNVRKDRVEIYAPTCNVEYINLVTRNIPHQFYFVVPEGLITIQELPPYAGLLVVRKKQICMIKRAPYLHKRKMDLNSILLDKFYNLWHFKQTNISEIEAQYKNQETHVSI